MKALARKPASAKALTKFCITSGRIMSAPLPAVRQRDRSKRSADIALAGDAARADIVAESGRIAERGALVAADEVEPRQWTAREMLGFEVIHAHLVGDQRQETPDQPHIVIPRQPADDAVAIARRHRTGMAVKIVQQRFVCDRNAGGEAGGAAGILKVTDIVGLRGRQRAFGRIAFGEAGPVGPFAALFLRCGQRHLGNVGRIDQDGGIGAGQLHAELVDIAFLAAEGGRQRQWHRPRADIDAGAEQRGEVRPGFRDQRHAVFRTDTRRDQPPRRDQRIARAIRQTYRRAPACRAYRGNSCPFRCARRSRSPR